MRSGVLAVQLLGPQPWHASLFYFLVAPLVQSSSPGVYFDPDTLDALVDNDGSGNATFVPCSVTGCGRFASCADNGANTPCTCSSADTQPTSDFATSRACVPAVASTEQQRVFWTLSMFAFGCGFVLCLFVMNGELHQRTLTHCTSIPLPSAHPSVAPQACKLTSSRLHRRHAEFMRNPQFSVSGGQSFWAYGAIALPDFVLSSTYGSQTEAE